MASTHRPPAFLAALRADFSFAAPRRVAALGFCLLALSTQSARADNFPAENGAVTPTAVVPRQVAETRVAGRVVLVARPYDSNFAVTSVRFLLDGRTLAEVGAPGRYSWDTRGLRAGRHIVQVQAFSNNRFIGISFPTALSIMPQSAAAAASRDGMQALVELGFHTYEIDARRAASVVAPRLAVVDGASEAQGDDRFIEPSSDLFPGAAARPHGLIVEVFLNGVRQDFAPAARLARADELEPLSDSISSAPASAASRASSLGKNASVARGPSTQASPRRSAASSSSSSRRVSSRRSRHRYARRRDARGTSHAIRVAKADRAAIARRQASQKAGAASASASRGTANAVASSAAASGKGVVRTVWMPARPLLERLGARVHWEASSRTLVADLDMAGGTRRITLCPDQGRPGEGIAWAEIGGRHMQLQMPVRQTENTLMVPLEFCVQALNLRTAWQKENRRLELWTPIAPA